MYQYYKITHEWAVKIGMERTSPRHPDGMHLVLPTDGAKVAAALALETGGPRLLNADALDAIGAIGLSPQEAHASMRGELRHDTPREPAEETKPLTGLFPPSGDEAEETENTDQEGKEE